MTYEKAKSLICPYNNSNCIVDKCMFWKTTTNGKKEIDRKTVPYDMTSGDIGDWTRRMKDNGYVNIGSESGFRDIYVKYEESYEGHCLHLKKGE